MSDIISEVQRKIAELQTIMAQKGKGGETNKTSSVGEVPSMKVTADISEKPEATQGGSTMPNLISRGGEPVQDGKLVDMAAIAAMAGTGGAVPQTDFMAMAKASDPYNEAGAQPGIVSRAGASESASETNTVINKELKGMPSTTEHAEALKGVEKPISVKKEASVDEIQSIVDRVKALRKANAEIDQVVKEQPAVKPAGNARESILARIRERMNQKRAKIDGAIVDPVKGSEDAGKSPEDSVKSIKKGESEMRPVEVMNGDKRRYSPDKGNDIRDKEAKDAISKGDKDLGKAEKEPKVERPLTNKKAALAGRLASMEVFAEDAARKEQNMPTSVKYPVEKSPDQDFEGAAKRTESEIKSEHAERAKDKGEKSPLKTTLWSDKREKRQAGVDREILRKQIAAYKDALKEIKGGSEDDLRKLETIEANVTALEKQMEKMSGKDASWQSLIQEGNTLYAGLVKMFAQIDSAVTPFLAKAAEVKSIRLAAEEEGEEHEEKESKEFEAGEKEEASEEKGEKKDDKDDKPKSKKKGPEKEVAGETLDLLESIRDTVKEIAEDIDSHLKDVEKKTGIKPPKPGDIKGLPGMGDGMDDMGMGGLPGEGLPEGGPELGMGDGAMEAEMGLPKPPMKLSVLDMFPKNAADEQQVVKAIMEDPALTPENKAKTVKNIQSQAGWKAVFTKLGEPAAAAHEPYPGNTDSENNLMQEWKNKGVTDQNIAEKLRKHWGSPGGPRIDMEKWNRFNKSASYTKLGDAQDAADAAKAAADNAEKENERLWGKPPKAGQPGGEGMKKEDEEKMVEGSAIVDKKNSYWSVYRGQELVARASVEDLYKDKAEEAFGWASSADYGRKLLSSILNEGLYTTAEKLGIAGMVRTAAKGKGAPDVLDGKSYYKKVYPASYVSEMFKSMKKKSEFQVSTLTTKVGELEETVAALKKANTELEENQVLHAKAEKALAMVRTAVEKGVIDQKDFNGVVDSVMLMDENAYTTFASTIAKAPTFKKESSMDQKLDMVKKASVERKPPVTLDSPIQIAASTGNAFTETRSQLEGIWKRPPTASQ